MRLSSRCISLSHFFMTMLMFFYNVLFVLFCCRCVYYFLLFRLSHLLSVAKGFIVFSWTRVFSRRKKCVFTFKLVCGVIFYTTLCCEKSGKTCFDYLHIKCSLKELLKIVKLWKNGVICYMLMAASENLLTIKGCSVQ